MMNDTTIATTTTNASSPTSIPPPVFIPCDNPRNLISATMAAKIELVCYVGIIPVIVVYGVITNVINMAVFARQGLRDRIIFCLFSLAMSDMGFLLTMICGKTYPMIGLINPEAGRFWKAAHFEFCSSLAFLDISNVITAIIALERCICVINPLKSAQFFKTKYTVTLIVGTTVYILGAKHLIHALKYETHSVTDPLTNVTTYFSRLSSPYLRHRTLIDVLYLYSVSVVVPCVCLVVVVVCTIVIVARLRATSSWRQSSMANRSTQEKQEAALMRMLVTVCGYFVICMTPSTIRVLLFSVLPGFLSTGYLCNTYRVSFALVLILENVNASINFTIYVRQSSQYQANLRAMCRCCRGSVVKKKDEVSSTVAATSSVSGKSRL